MTSTPKRVPIPKNGVDYRGKIVLAPMVRSGELPSRLLALHYGADLVWGPETVDRSMIGTVKRFNPTTSTIDFTRPPSNGSRKFRPVQKESLIYRLHPTREHGRLIFQIGTSSPTHAVEAAKLVAPDVAGIDVNAGCPKPFSTSGGMGAALLQTPELLASILEALVKEVGEVWEIGISVKIRILETAEKTEALVRRLCKTGITGLTVHCRTTPMRPRERAIRDQLKMIASICKEEGVACLMNGDVKDRDEALALVEEFGVDGAMIATAAESNPSCFRTKEDGGLLPWRTVTGEYVKTALEVQNRWGNTKFLLQQLMPGRVEQFRRIMGAKGYMEACEILGLEDLYEQARDVDKQIGITAHLDDHVEKARARNENESARAAGRQVEKNMVDAGRQHRLSERGRGVATALVV
ncbi:MAG: FMN-linked oxidoreductase [Lasallia pustulata]|uniref:FMN-linked oxidoreductase n=1 Tax=Lasallia pustulata TaxID=136370 RepID=A0A5M8Q2J3_9LECA|nr:MAG: FMN-linked oxidoreductase [Lasallia pustulata]